MSRPSWRYLTLVGIVFGWATAAAGHDARPLSISLYEQSGSVYRVRMYVPPSVDLVNEPRLRWPAGCELPVADAPTSLAVRGAPVGLSGLIACDSSIEGREVGIEYALFNPSISTVARFVPAEGSPRVSILPPDVSRWRVPRAPTRLEVARDYMIMGVRHIWEGVDHLLFVIGLLLLARTGRRMFFVISGFTVAHSLTLSLSALELVRVPVAPTEAAIALSILFLAAELAGGRDDRLSSRYPLLVSSSFGLLHGLGFAAALGAIGLPADEIVTSLLFFNLGVEAGQIAFILPFVLIAWMWNRHRFSPGFRVASAFVPRVRQIAPYGIGVLAAFWFIQRLTAF